MPTTRHGYSGSWTPLSSTDAIPEAWITADKHRWTATATQEDDPIAFGMEVFANGTMPDGTSLNREEKRYIAGIILNSIKEGE